MSASEPLEALGTEQINPRTTDLDQLQTLDLVQRLQAEDFAVAEGVQKALPEIATLVGWATEALLAGGSVHYFGAGTSGRLGVLDASEIPPTFGADPSWFQGHIAGGEAALRHAIEGAEDDAAAGAKAVAKAGLSARDLCLAISASGRTPYAIGAAKEALRRGAKTAALVSSEDSALKALVPLCIEVLTGPEAITGSTRLKAGSAQKMALNLVSTATMVQLGATYGNLMVGVQPTNAKLRARAARLVARITGKSEQATEALERAGGDVRLACVALHHDLSLPLAREHLRRARGKLREALQTPPS